jgi:hypothetical protein
MYAASSSRINTIIFMLSDLSKGYTWCFESSDKIGNEEEKVGWTGWYVGGIFGEEVAAAVAV